MRPRSHQGSRLRASAVWIGLAAPALAWLLYQQGLGGVVYVACGAGRAVGLAVGAACVAVCLSAGWAAWLQRDSATTMARRFLCRVGAGAALLFGLGVLIVMIAVLVIPQCAR